MTPRLYHLIRFAFITLALVHLTVAGLSIARYHGTLNLQLTWFGLWRQVVMTGIVCLLGTILAIMLKRPSNHIFLAGFLILFGISTTTREGWWWISGNDAVMELVVTVLTGTLFIYSMMRFAGARPVRDYQSYFQSRKRPRWYKHIVILFSRDKYFWLLFVPLLALFEILGVLLWLPLVYIINIVILAVGLIYFRISYHFSGKENQNKLLWLLWGLITTLVMYIVDLFLNFFYPDFLEGRMVVVSIIDCIICIAFIMAIFFSGSTDAGVIVRKTMLYSMAFLLALFIFGALEHWVIHNIAHALHIQSSILNSAVGAAVALLIRPIHHQLEHRLSFLRNKSKKETTTLHSSKSFEAPDNQIAG